MQKIVFLFIMALFNAFQLAGQNKDALASTALTLMAQVNQGNSYITFPADIGNIEPLWFEGNLIPNFYIRMSQNARLMGVLTPQIILRMYREESFPVRTPSYIPQITIYYKLKESGNSWDTALFGRIGHHSNGQEGNFLLENGEINLNSGDFSTNFLEAGFITGRYKPGKQIHQFFKSSLEVHPIFFIGNELEGIYSRYRWHSSLSLFKLPVKGTRGSPNNPAVSLKGETTWMFGDFNNLNMVSNKRLNLGLTLYYHPKFLEDIGLFVQFYHGADYYNIYFDHRLNVLRIGLMTEKLRF